LPFPPLKANNIEKVRVSGTVIGGKDLDPWVNNDARMEVVGETMTFPLPEERRNLKIGSIVDKEREKVIGQTLTIDADLFAWTTTDIPKIEPRIASHHLFVFK